jgi:hypothetical protein
LCFLSGVVALGHQPLFIVLGAIGQLLRFHSHLLGVVGQMSDIIVGAGDLLCRPSDSDRCPYRQCCDNAPGGQR